MASLPLFTVYTAMHLIGLPMDRQSFARIIIIRLASRQIFYPSRVFTAGGRPDVLAQVVAFVSIRKKRERDAVFVVAKNVTFG